MPTIALVAAANVQLADAAWNPFNWSSATYLVAIAGVLVLHRIVPRDGAWYVRLGREMLLIAPAVFLYFAVRGMVDAAARETEAIRNAESIIQLQERLGIFHEPALQAWILDSSTLVSVMNWVYIWGHWPVIVGTLVWLIIWRPERFSIYRNTFLLSGIAAMVVFAIFPVAPPRLMPDLAVMDTVTQHSQSYRVLQPPALTNPFAAMPSLHLGWNLLMGIAIVRESRLRVARAFGFAIPVGMFLAIILTANHYFLDGLAGGLLVLASFCFFAYLIREIPVVAGPGASDLARRIALPSSLRRTAILYFNGASLVRTGQGPAHHGTVRNRAGYAGFDRRSAAGHEEPIQASTADLSGGPLNTNARATAMGVTDGASDSARSGKADVVQP